MGDLIEVLRDFHANGDAWAILDLTPVVITEIEKLRAEIETLRKELEAAQAALVRQAGIMHRFGDKPDATG